MSEETVFVCNMNAFTADQRREYESLVQQLAGSIETVRELSNGYAFQLTHTTDILVLSARFIDHERLCCPFLGFNLELESLNRKVWLHLTGSDGVKPFILAEFDEAFKVVNH